MSKKEKIYLEKETLQEALEKIEESDASEIVLDISNDSPLRSTPDNFHIIKSRSSKINKEISIESTDPFIEEMANISGIESINPIFGKNENLVSDIIPKADGEGLDNFDKNDFFNIDLPDKNKSEKKKKDRKFNIFIPMPKSKKLLASGLVLLGILSYVSITLLPKATVVLALKETSISFEQSIEVSKDINSPNIEDENILLFPGEVITATRNNEVKFPASGEEEVERHATGEVFINNDLGSSLTLVEQTRLESPTGQIYKINERTLVPEEGVRVSVTASNPGEEYNRPLREGERWSIPGFAENGLTQEYEDVYAEPVTAMSGGALGLSKVYTDKDIENAREKLRSTLLNSLKSQILVVDSPNFKLLDEAINFKMIDERVNEDIGEEDNLGLFGQAQLTTIVFEDDKLKEELIKINNPDLDYDFKVVDSNIEYQDVSVDFENGSISFVASGEITIKPEINESNFKAQILGKKEGDLRSAIFSVPNLEKADVNLWPFWVKSVPEKENKVEIIFSN